MITALTWISIIAGGLLILMLLMSLIGGLDIDLDLGSTDAETDAGGLGVVKGLLTFLSVSSWVVKVLVTADKHIGVAIAIGLISGILAFWLLHMLVTFILKNESNVNWSLKDALYKTGQVYLKIPGKSGNGLIQVDINGVNREFKAKSFDQVEIKTGERIYIMDIEDEYAIVQLEKK